jgi:hypothetical protein
MSHRQKLEQVLDLLINEEHDAASELLHSVIVEKARQMYEELVDEDFGGDEKEDFADEIESDKEEIEADEIFDGAEEEGENVEDAESEESEESDEEGAEGSEEEIEDRVEDLESALAELTAEFEQLVGGEEAVELGDEDFADDSVEMGGEEGFGDEAGFGGEVEEVGAEEEGMYEESVEDEISEATKLQDEVASPGMEKEGKLAGTGKNSKAGAVNTTSMFTKAPSKADHGGKPHKVGGKDEAGYKAPAAKDHTPEDNIAVTQKKVSTSVEGEGKFAGTGKGSKGGAVNTTSTLGSGKGPKGN